MTRSGLLVREVRKAKSIFQTLIKDGCMQVEHVRRCEDTGIGRDSPAQQVQPWFGHPLRKGRSLTSPGKPQGEPDQASPFSF